MRFVQIEKKEIDSPERQLVFDLTVEDSASYNVNGIAVHNSVCETRVKTGIGVPQLSAVMECSRATDKPIIADGGIRTPSDAVKALAGGASLVMLGSMLSGTDETPGELVDGMKKFRGMASEEVNIELYGKLDKWKTSEGISTLVKAKGPVENVLHDITGGIRSAMTYVGVDNLHDLSKRAEFIRVTANTVIENKAHVNKNENK